MESSLDIGEMAEHKGQPGEYLLEKGVYRVCTMVVIDMAVVSLSAVGLVEGVVWQGLK